RARRAADVAAPRAGGHSPRARGTALEAPARGVTGDENERWAHRRDPDLDTVGRPPQAPEPARPPRAGRYGWIVGVVAVALLAYIALNTLRTSGTRPGPESGQPLPPFAVPRLDS